MIDNKPWYTSKTIWGAIVAIIVPLLGTITHQQLTDIDTQNLVDVLSSIGGGIGALVAIYGRVVATGSIGGQK